MKLLLKYICWCLVLCSVPAFAQPTELPIAGLTVNIPGREKSEAWEKKHPESAFGWPVYYYGFQSGDYILLDLKTEGRGTCELEIKEFSSGSVVYSAKDLTRLKRLQIPVPQKAVYEFTFRTISAEPVVCAFSLKRMPGKNDGIPFNPHVTWHYRHDTIYTYANEKVPVKTEITPQVLVDKTFRVFSLASIGNPSRVTVPFKLPPNTKHWVYWLGVGQESVKQLEETTKLVAKGGGAILTTVNPVAAFGMGLLPYLPQVKSSGYVDYLFLDQAAVKPFEEDGNRKPLTLPQGRAVVSDYGKITPAQTPKTPDGNLYLAIENKNTVTGLDVVLKIVAFQEVKQYETRRVRKIQKINLTRMPSFGE